MAMLAIVVVGATTGVAISQSRESADPGARLAKSADIAPQLSDAFAVFRRGRRESDQLRGLNPVGRGELTLGGANPTFARLVGDDGEYSAYAIPGDDALCEVLSSPAHGAGATCITARHAVATGSTITTGVAGSSDRMVYGIAPDWVDAVRFAGPSGETITAHVAGNGYIVRVPSRTQGGVLLGGTKSTAIRITNP